MSIRTFPTKAALTFVIALVASLSVIHAGQDLLVRVPFDFWAGETHLRPGSYILAMDRASNGSVAIRSAGHGAGVVVQTRKSSRGERTDAPIVTFRAYGDSRFLSAIQDGTAGERWELAPSADEAALSRSKGQPKVTSLKAELFANK